MDRLDARLVAVAAEEAALRLRLGQALEAMRQLTHYSVLGFSSLGAYALERCDRSVRWVEAACCLARRLEELPILRQASAAGRISWSMAELLSREATASNEAEWIAQARGRTLREMRRIVNEQRCQNPESGNSEYAGLESSSSSAATVKVSPASEGARPPDACEEDDSEAQCTLFCTLNREDFWLFEATRALLERMGTHRGDEQVEALLAEGQATLLSALPRGAIHLESLEACAHTEPPGRDACHRPSRQSGAEMATSRHFQRQIAAFHADDSAHDGILHDATIGGSSLAGKTAVELDALVRTLSRSLAEHEFVYAQLLLEFHRRDGWRELGHATEAQYARERLGLSRSSLLARRALAARLESLPVVAEALRTAKIGVEATCQIVRIAVPETEVAWLERAQRRTVKHLREEVVAALAAVRVSGETDCPPPLDGELSRFQELERAVLSGRIWREQSEVRANAEPPDAELSDAGPFAAELSDPVLSACHGQGQRRVWRAMLTSLSAWLTRGVRLSAASLREWRGPSASNTAGHSRTADGSSASADRIELRLRVPRGIRAWWRVLETQAQRWLPRGVSWMRFLCLTVWRDWHHLLGANVAYGGIYLRDRCQCSSPVCNRRDVTPHHLRFRSAGGDDSAANVTALCSWCHLFGVHGGCIRAQGEAPRIRWDLGPPLNPCVSVHGRERL